MKRPEKICVNPQCKEKIPEYKSSARKFCSSSCKNSYHYNKKLEEQEESIANERAIKRFIRLLKEMQEFEIEDFNFKKDSYFFNNIVFPSQKLFISDNGDKLYVIRFDNILINIDDETNLIKIIKHERTNKSFS
jgi:hypothetical protein